MNFMEALQFPFQDKNWVNKFVITIILLVIPILGWIVLSGYVVRLVRNLLNGVNELPEYEDYGADFSRGVMVFIGTFVYYLPIFILSCCRSVFNNDLFSLLCCFFFLVEFGYGLIITPLLMSAQARYAISEDLNAFLDFGGRINDLTTHTDQLVPLYIQLFIFYIVIGIGMLVGTVLCVIPGLVVLAVFVLGSAYFTAQWGKILGIGGTAAPVSASTM